MVFKKGEIANPEGRRPLGKDVVACTKMFLESYNLGELKTLWADVKKRERMPVLYSIVMQRIIEALEEGGCTSMNAMLDRIMGKAVETVNKNVTIRYSDESVSELGEILAGLGERGKKSSVQPSSLPH